MSEMVKINEVILGELTLSLILIINFLDDEIIINAVIKGSRGLNNNLNRKYTVETIIAV